MSYSKWGMSFNSAEDCPDFGSINCVKRRDNNVNDYVLRSTDLGKLSLITNAADGSTGLCIDTGDIYVLSLGEWVKFGEESTENTENQTQSVNLSPLNVNRGELTVDRGSNDISDNLTVEPTTENLTDDTSREELR